MVSFGGDGGGGVGGRLAGDLARRDDSVIVGDFGDVDERDDGDFRDNERAGEARLRGGMLSSQPFIRANGMTNELRISGTISKMDRRMKALL